MAFLLHIIMAACIAAFGCALPAQQFRKTAGAGDNSTRTSGMFGMDLSTYFSKSDFECLKSQGFDFAIIRAFESTGKAEAYLSCWF